MALSKDFLSSLRFLSRNKSSVKSRGNPKVSYNLNAESPLKISPGFKSFDSSSRILIPFDNVLRNLSSSLKSVIFINSLALVKSG